MYLLDTNVFITAKNTYYGTDFFAGFWNWIEQEYPATGLRSTAAVRQELEAQEDSLTAWARRMPDEFWLDETESDIPSLRKIAA